MKTATKNLFLLLTLLVTPLALLSQDKAPDAEKSASQGGMVEFGARVIGGEVYGRPDLPFDPSLKTSKFNEYRDLRDGFFIPRARMNWDNLDSKYYLDFQANKAIYRDQSYLATFGEWNRFKVQFRYDEIPHTYSDTARTIYTETRSGVFQIPGLTRNTLQNIAATAATTLPSTIQTQVVPGMTFFTPAIERRMGTLSFLYDLTSDWDFAASYSREHESGRRPLGMIFNSSPSASLTGGYGAEVPEPIDYFNDTVRVKTEYGREHWAFKVGYLGAIIQNNIKNQIFENNYKKTD